MKILPVILCGGSGTRLWPESRKKRPKQFLTPIITKTIIEQTININPKIDRKLLSSYLSFFCLISI